MGAQTENRL